MVGILKNISLILIFFIMVLLLLFTPLVVTLNRIHISMLLLLLVDLIKAINTLIKNISILILLLDNGKNLLLILLKVGIIKIKILKKKLKLSLFLFIKKIRDFSDNKVTFYYEDLSNNKEKVEVTIDVEKFLSKLIIHIPPKNFKMIRRFGIYSRNIKTELKFIISRMKKYKSQYTKTTFYQLEI